MDHKPNHWNKIQIFLFLFSLIEAAFIWAVSNLNGISIFDFIGGAFCHQIPDRTPQIDSVWFPFCFRCTGLFTGIFFSFIFFIRKGSPKAFSPYTLVFLCCSFLFFGLDILNSTTLMNINIYPDYTVSRLLSGFAVGYSLVLLITPLWNLVCQKNYTNKFPVTLNILWALFGAVLSCFCTYQTGTFGRIVMTILTVGTSLFFLSFLYTMIAITSAVYKSFSIQRKTAWLFGIGTALFQIACFGMAHILIYRYL